MARLLQGVKLLPDSGRGKNENIFFTGYIVLEGKGK